MLSTGLLSFSTCYPKSCRQNTPFFLQNQALRAREGGGSNLGALPSQVRCRQSMGHFKPVIQEVVDRITFQKLVGGENMRHFGWVRCPGWRAVGPSPTPFPPQGTFL